MKNLYLGLSIILLMALMSCAFLSKSQPSMPASSSSSISIKYTTQFVPNPEFVDDGEYQFSELLQLEILRCNVPMEKTIWVDGKHSRTEFICNDWEYIGKSIEMRWQDENGMRIAAGKEFPDFSWYHEFNAPIASSEETFPTQFHLLGGTKQIAGYDCQQGRVETANGSFELYYCPDLHVLDETEAIPGWPEVPGLVMEIHRTADKFQGRYLQLTIATEVRTDIQEAGLYKMPSDFTLMTSDEAKTLQKEKFQARSAEPMALTQYLGSWHLDNGKDNIVLEISGTASELFISRNNIGSTHKTISKTETLRGRLFKGGIWVDTLPNGHEIYVLNETGELVWEARPAFHYIRED